jgi:ectoine hydroxylase-related dioxygenase (phytanoyl-CoA dioxygenase family)
MTDFTEENGATRLMPGSQHLPNSFEHTIDETVPAEMSKGSCLLYTGKVYHGGGENKSDNTRIGMNITYNVGWLRQEENQYLSVPREIAEELPDDLLRLMGYRTGAYALGYVDDLRDPLDVLRGSSGAASFGDSAAPKL